MTTFSCTTGKEIDGFEMKLGWGKAVPIPPHPVYVPPALAELTLPPPPSGLPFNCQPNKHSRHYSTVPPPNDHQQTEEEQKQFEKVCAFCRQVFVAVLMTTYILFFFLSDVFF